MKKNRYKSYFATMLIWCGITFPTMAQEAPKFTVAEAPEWSALFKRKDGWFGADGIFVLPVNGVDKDKNKAKTMMLVFSDTMIGKIKGTSLQPGFKMIHNSVAILKGEAAQDKNISFYWKSDRKGSPQPLFKPKTKNSGPGEYFWLGDGFVNNDMDKATYIFAYRIKDTGGAVFGFAEKGNVLIKIPAGSKPPFLDQKQMDTPFYIAGNTDSETGSFGGGIFVNTANAGAQSPDGFVYVYGVKGSEKNVIVARVEPGKFEQFKEWKFWDGGTWNSDIRKVAGIADHASNASSGDGA